MQLFNSKSQRKETETPEIDASVFGVVPGQDCTSAMRQLLKMSKAAGVRRIVLAPGIYHFHPERAEERYCAISNNDNGLKRSPFPLIGFDDLEIDGQGAEFIFHGFQIPFLIEDSRKIVLKNFSVDWEQPFYFQATVLSSDAGTRSFEIQAHPECQGFIWNNELFFGNTATHTRERRLSIEPVTWRQNLYPNYVFDGRLKHIATGYPDLAFLPQSMRQGANFRAEDLGSGVFRLTEAAEKMPEPGVVLIATGNLFPNRHSPAIRVLKTNDLLIQDVTVHHAGAMGLIAERSENITLERFDVRLREDSQRLVTTVADATHFVYCRGTILLKDCLFENMLDDATNIHGCYVRVISMEGSTSVLARIMHHQQFGFTFAEPGDRLRFSTMQHLESYGEAEVESVEIINEELVQITFARSIVDLLRPDSILDNASWQPDVVITGCTVRNNRARSLLLSTGGSVQISHNAFIYSSMSNVLMEGDSDYWHESGPSTKTVISENRFVGLSATHAAIHISPKNVMPWPEAYHQNIRIEKNHFESASGAIIHARSVENLVFQENTLSQNFSMPSSPNKPGFDLAYCRQIRIENNASNSDFHVACGPETSEITADKSTRGGTIPQPAPNS